jgi:hypothetical protein
MNRQSIYPHLERIERLLTADLDHPSTRLGLELAVHARASMGRRLKSSRASAGSGSGVRVLVAGADSEVDLGRFDADEERHLEALPVAVRSSKPSSRAT